MYQFAKKFFHSIVLSNSFHFLRNGNESSKKSIDLKGNYLNISFLTRYVHLSDNSNLRYD